jgi:hypothetical protein
MPVTGNASLCVTLNAPGVSVMSVHAHAPSQRRRWMGDGGRCCRCGQRTTPQSDYTLSAQRARYAHLLAGGVLLQFILHIISRFACGRTLVTLTLRLSRKHFLHSTRCAHGNVCMHARFDTQMMHCNTVMIVLSTTWSCCTHPTPAAHSLHDQHQRSTLTKKLYNQHK